MNSLNTDLLDDRIDAALEKRMHNGGGSGYNNGMWEQSVESRLGRIENDLRHVWVAFIGGTVVIVSMIIGSYLLLDQRMDGIDKALVRIEAKLP